MGTLNKAMIIGNLGRDPEILRTGGGVTVAKFPIATSEKSMKDGGMEEKTEWHNVVLFGRVAEVAEKHLKKGSKIFVEGRMSTEKWTDKDGAVKYSFKVKGSAMQMLGGNNAVDTTSSSGYQKQDGRSYFDQKSGDGEISKSSNFNDDIPF